MTNLEPGITTELMFYHMRPYGDIQYINVPRYGYTGDPRMFAFVYFKTAQQA